MLPDRTDELTRLSDDVMLSCENEAIAGRWVARVSTRGPARERVDMTPEEYAKGDDALRQIYNHLKPQVEKSTSAVQSVIFGRNTPGHHGM